MRGRALAASAKVPWRETGPLLRSGRRASLALDLYVLIGVDLLLQAITPGREQVGPRFDGVRPAADPIDGDRRVPAIGVGVEGERHQRPARVTWSPEQDAGGQLVVAFFVDVGADPDDVTGDSLDGKAAPIQLRGDALDGDALEAAQAKAAIGRLGHEAKYSRNSQASHKARISCALVKVG